MRLSIARVSAAHGRNPGDSVNQDHIGFDVRAATWRWMAVALAAALVLGCVGILFGTPKSAEADTTVFQSGDVFASVGNSTVYAFDAASGDQVATLQDNTSEPYTAGSAFDANGNFYVTDDINGDISEFSPTGVPLPTFATGLSNPLSIVFDNSGNMYVGQQSTPYIAEFAPDGTRLPDIGPLQTELYGDDWIDLASDECTFYYTTEGTDILTYNKCTNTQGPNFNKVPFPSQDPSTGLPVNAFQLKILADGDVLVADSNAVLLLDQNGNVIQTYPCSSLPNCGGQLFAISVDPSGTSFWTGDSSSGYIYQINIATGALMQTINSQSGTLYGLSVLDQKEVATLSQTTTAATPTALAIQPVSGNFSSPTPVSAVLTDSSTNTPIPGEVITFTLNGSEICSATTDDTGTASCVITPGEPSSSYTLTASFPGDSSQSTPIGSASSSSVFTVNPDTSSLTYTGPTSAVNGSSTTLTGTLTTDAGTPDTPLPTKVVTFTVGSGSTAQSCSGTTDPMGKASCTIAVVDQPVSNETVTTSFGGDVYDSPESSTTPLSVTEPTTLTVHSATGNFSDATTVSGVLTDTNTNAPIAGEPVKLTLDNNETCTAMTDSTGTASCSLTPSEPAATYALTGTFAGDATLPLELMSSNGASTFVVTQEETALTYTGATVAQNGQPLALSGVLTTDDPSAGTPIIGRLVTFTLGSGSSAQICTATTTASGLAACSISSVNQSPGPTPVTDTFAGDAYYQTASASSTVNLPEGTQLTVTPTAGVYSGPTTVSATLVNTYTGQPVPGEPVTLTVNGTQPCAATTGSNGVASCTVTPNEPSGTYSLTASFTGDSSSMPQLNSSSTSSTFVVTLAPTTLTYTGTTSVTNGQPATLSGVLTTSEPSPGTDVAGRQVTFTIGSGSSLQSCSGTTGANGTASCTIASVNQTSGMVGISDSFTADNNYQSSTAASTATVHTPTTLTVYAGTSDFADAGTISGQLTNSVTGVPIAGEQVTLTLAATQSCTATTDASGVASCSITPNEAAGTDTLTGTFAGDTSRAPQLLASAGSNAFVVTHEETMITYTGLSVAVIGSTFTLSANLTSDVNPLGGRPVLMTLGSGSTAQSCTGTTDATGNASCIIASVNQTSGTIPIAVTFSGDAYYKPASAPASVIVAGVADIGGFVIGDVSAKTPPAPMHPYTSVSNGSQVNFWGSQTWKTNKFSGVNNAPASMKGYVDNAPANLGLTGNLGCGETWTTDPGNSSRPPATIPDYMVVIVSSQITNSGSTESGNITHVVVVEVEPSYGPAPGNTGWGPIVAWLC